MAYIPKTRFERKDALPQDDPNKVIYGSEFSVEFDAISDAFGEVETSLDEIKEELENGTGGGSYDDTQIKADLAKETRDRTSGDAALDLRIDAVEDSIGDGGDFVDAPNDGKLYGRQSQNWEEVPSGGVSDWADIENKPTEFPPSNHTHEIAEVNGLQDALDNAGTSYSVAIGDAAPANGKSGDTWFDSTEGEGALYIHDGDVWFSSNTFSQAPEPPEPSSGGGSIEAIASGALATGEAVIVNSDGTVSVIVGTPVPTGLGEPTTWFNDDVDYPIAAYDPIEKIVLVAFQASYPSNNAAMVVGTMSGDTITFGEVTQIEGTGPTYAQIALCSIGQRQFVIAYASAGKYGYAHMVTVDSGSNFIRYGTAKNFASFAVKSIAIAYDQAESMVMCVYRKQDNGVGAGMVLTLNREPETINIHTERSIDSTLDHPNLTYDPVQKKFMCVYEGGSGYPRATVLEIDSTTVQMSSPIIINSAACSWLDTTYDVSARQHVFVFCNEGDTNLSGTSWCIEIQGGARELTLGEYEPINATRSEYFSISYDPVREKVFALYRDFNNSNLLTTVYGKVTGKKCSWETPDSTTHEKPVVVSQVDPDSGNVWVIGRDFTQLKGNAWRYLPAYTASNLTATNYIGTASADYADGEAATIQTVGSVSEDQSGLTAGLGYYVQPDGSLGASGSVFAGTAISPTKLIVKG